MTETKCLEDVEKKFWKLIREYEVNHKGEIFRLETWVYPCGGTVEYREDIDEEGNRIYIVERSELSPKSWVRGKPIATAGSLIITEKLKNREEALQLARKWRNEVIPCEVCETEKSIVFKFKTMVKPLKVRKVQIAGRV
jgi:hypothetical protein